MVKLNVASLKKAVRNGVETRGMKKWYFCVIVAMEIGMVVVWISVRLDVILPSSGKRASSITV